VPWHVLITRKMEKRGCIGSMEKGTKDRFMLTTTKRQWWHISSLPAGSGNDRQLTYACYKPCSRYLRYHTSPQSSQRLAAESHPWFQMIRGWSTGIGECCGGMALGWAGPTACWPEVFTLPLVFRPESGWSPGIPPDWSQNLTFRWNLHGI